MTRISKLGSSLGVALSSDVLAAAHLAEGDEVIVTPIENGLIISAATSPQARMLAAAMADMDARPDTYRKLAE